MIGSHRELGLGSGREGQGGPAPARAAQEARFRPQAAADPQPAKARGSGRSAAAAWPIGLELSFFELTYSKNETFGSGIPGLKSYIRKKNIFSFLLVLKFPVCLTSYFRKTYSLKCIYLAYTQAFGLRRPLDRLGPPSFSVLCRPLA